MFLRTRHLAFALALSFAPFAHAQGVAAPVKEGVREPKAWDTPGGPKAKVPTLWKEQKDISSLDLFYGQGGEKGQPKTPFTFDSEDKGGSNPKFDVKDSDDKKWRVKLGEEAKPEIVASRLLWAMGYFANDDYLLPQASVANLKLKRGGDRVGANGKVEEARFQRKPGGQKKAGTWKWRDNPFTGQREFNGLRVMMAVMNNWDLKDENNAVYTDDKRDRKIYLVSDVGASFGTNGLSFTRSRSKGNIDSFKSSKFITSKTAATVDFGTPAPPGALLLKSFGFAAITYAKRAELDWIGNGIPIEDARWIGHQLGQLSHKQLQDAFRAGDFSQEEIDAYVDVVEERIGELKAL